MANLVSTRRDLDCFSKTLDLSKTNSLNNQSMKIHPCIDPSLLPSSSGTSTPPVNTARNSSFTAPGSKVTQMKQKQIHVALIEATKRADNAEGKTGQNPPAAYEHLTAQNATLKKSLANQQKRTKACEKAMNKAQGRSKRTRPCRSHDQ